MKKCKKCEKTKDISEFSWRNKKAGIRNTRCKSCDAEYYQEHKEQDTEKLRAQWREASKKYLATERVVTRRITRHGISKKDYDDLVAKHNGLCWSCFVRPAYVIDHDHTCCPGPYSCGKCVRGVLCTQCNTSLGLMQDDPALIRRLEQYATKTMRVAGKVSELSHKQL